jgi:hypothetical protein
VNRKTGTAEMSLKQKDLKQLTGSENWHRQGGRNVLFTDGAKHAADAGGAYWLLDEIAIAQIPESGAGDQTIMEIAWHVSRQMLARRTALHF